MFSTNNIYLVKIPLLRFFEQYIVTTLENIFILYVVNNKLHHVVEAKFVLNNNCSIS